MRSPRSAVVLGLVGAACAIMSAHAGCGGNTAVTREAGATASATSTSSSSATTSSGAGGASGASTSSSSATTTTSSGAGGTTGAGGTAPPLDAGSDGPPCAPAAFIEAGTGWEGDAEVPIYHRPAPSCCPTDRGSPGGQPYGPGKAMGCTTDSQCTQGPDGRCFPFGGLVWTSGCSYDECFTDSDCPSGAPCICRMSASDDSVNICATGGNCVVDSDCGPGGFCSPSVFCNLRLPGWPGYPYYCHTAADTCINDADCPPIDAGAGCGIPSVCLYDGQAKHWACNDQKCCPP